MKSIIEARGKKIVVTVHAMLRFEERWILYKPRVPLQQPYFTLRRLLDIAHGDVPRHRECVGWTTDGWKFVIGKEGKKSLTLVTVIYQDG